MSICHPHDPEPAPASPEALWGNARGCWEAFALLFGAPLQLVGSVFIRCTERNEANAYLRALEALVRRLLFIEAATHPVDPGEGAKRRRPETRPSNHLTPIRPAHPREGWDPAQQGKEIDPYEDKLDTEDNTLWPAHFAMRLNTLLGANQRERDPTFASHWPAKRPCKSLLPPVDPPSVDLPRFAFAAPIALRFEALRRVIDNPDPYIQRAARALAAFRRRNRPPRLAPTPTISGDNSRFFYTPLKLIDATATAALGELWPDTS